MTYRLASARRRPRTTAHPTRRRAASRAVAAVVLSMAASAALAQVAGAEISALRFSGFGSVGLSHVDAPAGWSYGRGIGASHQTGWTAMVCKMLVQLARYPES